eukprot:1152861-Pelagomonas_calceolata.AAC.2
MMIPPCKLHKGHGMYLVLVDGVSKHQARSIELHVWSMCATRIKQQACQPLPYQCARCKWGPNTHTHTHKFGPTSEQACPVTHLAELAPGRVEHGKGAPVPVASSNVSHLQG